MDRDQPTAALAIAALLAATGAQAEALASTLPQAGVTNVDRFGPWIWYGTPAAFLLLVLVALVIYAGLWTRRPPRPRSAGTTAARMPSVAYLVSTKDSAQRYLIGSLPCRIGRAATNDIILDDPSVSRTHAEIQRHADGSFTITDLDSLNGVYINDKKVRHARLAEGLRIDIGDVTLRFTFHDSAAPVEEPTLVTRDTRTSFD